MIGLRGERLVGAPHEGVLVGPAARASPQVTDAKPPKNYDMEDGSAALPFKEETSECAPSFPLDIPQMFESPRERHGLQVRSTVSAVSRRAYGTTIALEPPTFHQ
jgi:hypothetical protein